MSTTPGAAPCLAPVTEVRREFRQTIECPACYGGKWLAIFAADGTLVSWTSEGRLGEAPRIAAEEGRKVGTCPTCSGAGQVLAEILVVLP